VFRVSGFGFRAQGLRLEGSEGRIQGVGFRHRAKHRLRVQGFGFRVSCLGFRGRGLGFGTGRSIGLGFRVSGFGFRVWGFVVGVRVSAPGEASRGFRVLGFGFRVSSFEFMIQGSGFRHLAEHGAAHELEAHHQEMVCDQNVQRFRGGLVFMAHILCVSLNSRLESNKEEEENLAWKGFGFGFRVS